MVVKDRYGSKDKELSIHTPFGLVSDVTSCVLLGLTKRETVLKECDFSSGLFVPPLSCENTPVLDFHQYNWVSGPPLRCTHQYV